MNNVCEYSAVHLDLKGVPPTFERLVELLDIFKAAGHNSILIEWEDMFPWSVDERFKSPTAYSPDQVKDFVRAARERRLEIIPLIQCLGHMENFLKFNDYIHLREVPGKSDCINPLAEGASDFIVRIIDDVLSLCDGIKFFHLGGDEAWTFGTHPHTKEFISNHDKASLYKYHFQPLFNKLNKKGIRPVIWHDMLIEWTHNELKELAGSADVCVWGYAETPDETDSHYNMNVIKKFINAGLPLWGGSAFKGADGASRDVPNPHERRRNANAWMNVAKSLKFKGLISTGWSRYSSTRLQCEPIDANLDALLYIGWILSWGYNPGDYQEKAFELLKKVGGFDEFNRCHQSCRKLDSMRKDFWVTIQDYYEQFALDRFQPERNAREVHLSLETLFRERLQLCMENVMEFKRAFKGLVERVHIEEYLDSRLHAMKQAFADFEPKFKQAQYDKINYKINDSISMDDFVI